MVQTATFHDRSTMLTWTGKS